MDSYISLYRKWRPSKFSDVWGQDHITKTLKNQIKNKSTTHAYLFCGSRGTGKTTCAKILAKAVNCEAPVDGDPCNVCENCVGIERGHILDVYEIDAASNNSVENIREIRDEILFMPGDAKKKVYIIDEVHMLSQGAFNAFLKTLEEPPEHIIFILATTELNKIPPTILSRCQRHDFRRIPAEIIKKRLELISENEHIDAEPDALALIARLAGGGFRDAIGMLEVCAANAGAADSAVTYKFVEQTAGYTGGEKTLAICRSCASGDAVGALSAFWELYDNSLDCQGFLFSMLEAYKNLSVMKLTGNKGNILELSAGEEAELGNIAAMYDRQNLSRCTALINGTVMNLGRYGQNKRTAAEILLLSLAEAAETGTDGETVEQTAGKNAPAPKKAGAAVKSEDKTAEVKAGSTPESSAEFPLGREVIFKKYAEFIADIAKKNAFIPMYLKSARCTLTNTGALTNVFIATDNEFKRDTLLKQENLNLINAVMGSYINGKFNINIKMIDTDSGAASLSDEFFDGGE